MNTQRCLLTNDSGLVVHAEPNTGNLHLLSGKNDFHSLSKEWCSTMILNQGTIIVYTWLTNAWLNATLEIVKQNRFKYRKSSA